MTRTTIALEDRLYRALKLKAAVSSRSLSDLVSEAIRMSLKEDAADLSAFDERKKEHGRPFDAFLAELRRDGLL